MKKIYFRRLIVEVTRRCQLKCEHCMRGDAQDLDISTDIIDSILEQTAGIGELFFTGGEPTLAPDKMNYFVDRMIEENIPLGGINYITNGIELSEEVKAFLGKAHSYITESRKNSAIFRSDCKIYYQPRIEIGVSLDNYHGDNKKVKHEYECFLPSDSCHVRYVNNSIPQRIGRGKNLKYGLNPLDEKIRNTQIGIEYKNHHLLCDDSPRSKEMLQYCDAFIPCGLELTATGKLFSMCGLNGEYTVDDNSNNAICQFANGKMPNIFDSVLEYNIGRDMCYITRNIPSRHSIEELQAIDQYKKVHETDTESQTWPILYDKIFADDVHKAAWQIERSKKEYENRYKQHLRERIGYYSDDKEIKIDFPYCNDHFCHELQNMIKECSVDKVIEWIISTKNCYWYFIDDKFFELAKHHYNQKIYSAYKRERENSAKKMNEVSQGAFNRILLDFLKTQLR